MPTNFIFRFEKANLFIPFQMPNKSQRQAAVNRQTTPEDARRSSVIARMEKIKDQLQIPEYVEQNQPRVWLEESYDLGDLVFAVLDIPWKAFYEKAQNLLEQYKDYEMTIRTDLLTQVDWRHYQPPQPEKESHEPSFKKWFPLNLFTRPVKKSSAQEPPAATEGTSNHTPRTIAQRLAAPEQTAYCQVAQLYNDVKHSLADYPAMAALLAHYCTNAASDYYLQAIKTLDMTRLTDLDRSIMEQNGFLRVLHHEIYWCDALVQCSECVERYMKSFPTPDFPMKSYAGMDDRELCAASVTILKMMANQFRLLADFQPELASLVQYTLVEADLHPDKSADQRYGDALLVRHSGVAAGQKLYEQLRLRMLGRLSLPQEKPPPEGIRILPAAAILLRTISPQLRWRNLCSCAASMKPPENANIAGCCFCPRIRVQNAATERALMEGCAPAVRFAKRKEPANGRFLPRLIFSIRSTNE